MFASKKKEGMARDIQKNDYLQSSPLEKLHSYTHYAIAKSCSAPV